MSLLHRLWERTPAGLRRTAKALPGTSALRDRSYGVPAGPDPEPGAPRPVVYLPTWLRWDVMRQRPQYLLEALARAGHEVWFVDPRLDEPRTPVPGVHLVPSLAPVPSSGAILYTHFAPTRTLVDRFDRPAVVYDILDDLSIYDAGERGLPERSRVRLHHASLVETAGVVIASNPRLIERHRRERQDIVLVENGVDLGRFDPRGSVASELPSSPVVGFHGAIAPWIDLELLAEVAAARPQLSFVLVGPVEPPVRDRMARLATSVNVAHIGEQPPARIPEFVRGFSAGVIPFVVDDMTSGVTPLKMYEYLASALPVVATPLPACVDHPDVATAPDAASFASALDQALQMSPEERSGLRARALDASWDRRIVPLLERLDALGLRTVP